MAEVTFNVDGGGGSGDERGRVLDRLNANLEQLNRRLSDSARRGQSGAVGDAAVGGVASGVTDNLIQAAVTGGALSLTNPGIRGQVASAGRAGLQRAASAGRAAASGGGALARAGGFALRGAGAAGGAALLGEATQGLQSIAQSSVEVTNALDRLRDATTSTERALAREQLAGALPAGVRQGAALTGALGEARQRGTARALENTTGFSFAVDTAQAAQGLLRGAGQALTGQEVTFRTPTQEARAAFRERATQAAFQRRGLQALRSAREFQQGLADQRTRIGGTEFEREQLDAQQRQERIRERAQQRAAALERRASRITESPEQIRRRLLDLEDRVAAGTIGEQQAQRRRSRLQFQLATVTGVPLDQRQQQARRLRQRAEQVEGAGQETAAVVGEQFRERVQQEAQQNLEGALGALQQTFQRVTGAAGGVVSGATDAFFQRRRRLRGLQQQTQVAQLRNQGRSGAAQGASLAFEFQRRIRQAQRRGAPEVAGRLRELAATRIQGLIEDGDGGAAESGFEAPFVRQGPALVRSQGQAITGVRAATREGEITKADVEEQKRQLEEANQLLRQMAKSLRAGEGVRVADLVKAEATGE